MTLKTWQLQLLESIDGWEKFCLTQSDIADQKKQQFLDMAKNGEPRPDQRKHPFGKSLTHYTSQKSKIYDQNFDGQIRNLRPDWFVFRSDIANQKKQKILEMAKNNEPRPVQKLHELGLALSSYSSPSSGSYDPIFDKQIRKLRFDWFVSMSDTANQKKQQLLEMAHNGEPRPNQKTNLGIALSNYKNPNNSCYDPEFVAEIIKLKSDWFVSSCDKNKKQLLEMAQNGEPRPNQRTHELGRVLCFYTNQNNPCYDPEFSSEILKVKPDWFVSQSDIAEQKKKQLFEVARNGEPKPKHSTHKLGQVLCSYMNPNHGSYDPDFNKEIRKLRPDWFRS